MDREAWCAEVCGVAKSQFISVALMSKSNFRHLKFMMSGFKIAAHVHNTVHPKWNVHPKMLAA